MAVLAQEAAPERTGPISLIADSVKFDPKTQVLVATGNVQVFRGTERRFWPQIV